MVDFERLNRETREYNNKNVDRFNSSTKNNYNYFDINKLNNIVLCTDLLGIWCQLEVEDIYPFTKYEKSKNIQFIEPFVKTQLFSDF